MKERFSCFYYGKHRSGRAKYRHNRHGAIKCRHPSSRFLELVSVSDSDSEIARVGSWPAPIWEVGIGGYDKQDCAALLACAVTVSLSVQATTPTSGPAGRLARWEMNGMLHRLVGRGARNAAMEERTNGDPGRGATRKGCCGNSPHPLFFCYLQSADCWLLIDQGLALRASLLSFHATARLGGS